MKTSTIVVMGVLGLAATPLALHLAGGSTPATKSWIKTLHGGSAGAMHGGSGGSGVPVVPAGSGVPVVLHDVQDKKPEPKPAPKPAPATLAGKWTVNITSDQGDITSTMALNQDGRKITGTFANPHGEGNLPVAGELVNGALTMSVDATTDHGEMHLAFKGTVKDDGSLAGTMTSAMGESKWAATRIKDKQ